MAARVEQEESPEPEFNNNKWGIRRKLDSTEIKTGNINLTHHEIFNKLIDYHSNFQTESILTGKRLNVTVCDSTDERNPLMYGPNDDHTFFEKGLNDEYVLGLNLDLIEFHGLKKGDQIGISYDCLDHIFFFRVFLDTSIKL